MSNHLTDSLIGTDCQIGYHYKISYRIEKENCTLGSFHEDTNSCFSLSLFFLFLSLLSLLESLLTAGSHISENNLKMSLSNSVIVRAFQFQLCQFLIFGTGMRLYIRK